MTKKRTVSLNPEGDGGAELRRRRFDATFKQEAVALGKRIGIRQAAIDLTAAVGEGT